MDNAESHFCSFGDEDPENAAKTMRTVLGPQAVDQAVRQAISICWMMLPKDKKSVSAVEVEINRIVDRALKNFREDCHAYGIPRDV